MTKGAVIIFHAGHITRVYVVGRDMDPNTWYRFDETGAPILVRRGDGYRQDEAGNGNR